jgi:hypothetical protein
MNPWSASSSPSLRFFSGIALRAFSGLIVALAFVAASTARAGNEVATIDGAAIEPAEFALFVSQNRAVVFDLFQAKYSIGERPDFWTSTFSGHSPAEAVKQLALDQLTRIKVEQSLAMKHGLIGDIGYTAFLKELEELNPKRKAIAKAGGVIYGPVEYGIPEYYHYRFYNLIIKLKDKLIAAKELTVSDDQLHAAYEAAKETRFAVDMIHYVKVNVRTPPKNSEKSWNDATQRNLLDELRDALQGGQLLDAAIKRFAAKGVEFATTEATGPLQFRGEEETADDPMSPIRRLSVGQTSDVFNDPSGPWIATGLKTERTYQSFEEAKRGLELTLLQDAYEKLIREKTAAAHIVINRSVYDGFPL